MRYKFNGPNPVDLPAMAIMGLQPGEEVEVEDEIVHPDFEALADPPQDPKPSSSDQKFAKAPAAETPKEK